MARFTAVLSESRAPAREPGAAASAEIEIAGRWLRAEAGSPAALARSRSGRALAACDGALFATGDLARELGLPRGAGSAAVFAEGLERHGQAFLSRVNGAFGLLFARSDPPEVVVARDRLGLRSLYATSDGADLAVGSALRPLIERRGAGFDVDPQGLAGFLLFGEVAPPRTLAAGIEAMLPGCWRRWRPEAGWQSGRWWSLGEAARARGESGAETVREALLEALREQIDGVERPAVFVSGGADSSALLLLLGELGCSDLHTVSLAVAAPDHDLSEGDAARRIARHCGTTHVEALVDQREVAGCLDAFFAAMDQPTVDGLNTFLVARSAARHGLSIAFSGFGGDELFAGYRAFASLRSSERMLAILAHAPRSVRRSAAAAVGALGGRGVIAQKASHLLASVRDLTDLYALRRALYVPEQVGRLCGIRPDAAIADSSGRDRVARWSALELGHRVPDTLARCCDVFGAAAGVELRLPYLDHRVVECALAVPEREKLSGSGPKPLLRAVLRGRLPAFVWRDPKRHFHVPLERWLARSLVEPPELSRWLDPREVEQVVAGFTAGSDPRRHSRVWALVVLERVLLALCAR